MEPTINNGKQLARSVNLAGSQFKDVNLASSQFKDVNLEGAVFDDVNLKNGTNQLVFYQFPIARQPKSFREDVQFITSLLLKNC